MIEHMKLIDRIKQRPDEPSADTVARITAQLASLPAEIDAAERAANIDEMVRLEAAERVLRRQLDDAVQRMEHDQAVVELAETRAQRDEVFARRTEASERLAAFELMTAVYERAAQRERDRVGPLASLGADLASRVQLIERKVNDHVPA